MGSVPPGQSPPREADTHYLARSGDRYTGLARRRLAVEAVRTLSLCMDMIGEHLRGGKKREKCLLQVIGPLLIGIEAG